MTHWPSRRRSPGGGDPGRRGVVRARWSSSTWRGSSASEPELNAFRRVMGERALIDARQADGRRGAGDDRPLLGVPIAVKDTEDVGGERTGWGTAVPAAPAARDNEFITRLRAAGAVIMGKTNLPELAIMGDTEGPAFGVTRNHGTPLRSAAARAAEAPRGGGGPVRCRHGRRRPGSIRIPAANSACRSKPQRDRISLAPVTEHWYGSQRRRLPYPHGGRHRVAARRRRPTDGRSTLRPRGETGPVAHRASLKPPSRAGGRSGQGLRARGGDALSGLGHEVIERDPTGAGRRHVHGSLLAGIAQEAERVGARNASSGALAASRGWAARRSHCWDGPAARRPSTPLASASSFAMSTFCSRP